MRRFFLLIMCASLLCLAGCADDGDDGQTGAVGSAGADAINYGTIEGLVLDASGNPVADATVDTDPTSITATTNEDGEFTLSDIAIGSYQVTATKSGAGAATVMCGVAAGGITSMSITLTDELDVPATIMGTILNTEGAGIMGATVSVAGQTDATTTTALDGSFSLSDLTPGYLFLNVQAPSDTYLDGGNRKALFVQGGETVTDLEITLSGRPSADATYVGMATCEGCHGSYHIGNVDPALFDAYNGSETAAIHSRFVTEGTSHLVYKSLWPDMDGVVLPKNTSGGLLKVQDPATGSSTALVNLALCREDASEAGDRYTPVGEGEQFLFKFYATGDLAEGDLDCDTDTAGATWIPVAATIGGEGNWGEGYTDETHAIADSHPNFGEGKQRYMCRLEDVPYIKQWNLENGVDRTGQPQDYVAYMPAFIMQDGTPVGSDILEDSEPGTPTFWQKSPSAWCGPYNTLSRNCAGCHATGLKLETADITDDDGHSYKSVVTYWEYKDLNVTCERCHGPGSDHLAQKFDNTTLIMPQYLTTQAANETCGQCHGNHDGRSSTPAGVYKPAYDGTYTDTLGYGFFVPGVYSLETFFANFNQPTTTLVPDWTVGSFHTWPDQTHSRPHSQEYLELRRSVHYNNSYETLACFDCHNAHTLNGGPASREVDGYEFSNVTYANNTLCLTCHATRGSFTDVSIADVAVLQVDAGRTVTKDDVEVTFEDSEAALARNQVAKAVAEHMQVKAGMGGALYTPTDSDMPVGSCTSCHMAKIGKLQDINVDFFYHLAADSDGNSAVAEGNVPSHVFDIVWPGQSSVLKNSDPASGHDYDIMPNSCSKCHEFARISGDLD